MTTIRFGSITGIASNAPESGTVGQRQRQPSVDGLLGRVGTQHCKCVSITELKGTAARQYADEHLTEVKTDEQSKKGSGLFFGSTSGACCGFEAKANGAAPDPLVVTKRHAAFDAAAKRG